MTTDHPMQLGMIGLGRMGANLVRRLMRDGHRCVVYDVNAGRGDELAGEGATGADDARGLRGHAREAAGDLDHGARGDRPARRSTSSSALLEPDDIVIDGGNSYYRDDITRAKALAESGIHYVDCGTSGGVWGLDRGYCLMIGGEDAPWSSTSTRSSRRSLRARAAPSRRPGAPAPTGPPRTATCTAGRTAPATS